MTESRLTFQQRLAFIEVDIIRLHEEIKIMHNMIKQNKENINDFILTQLRELNYKNGGAQ